MQSNFVTTAAGGKGYFFEPRRGVVGSFAEHFSKERLGPYFYTCLMRLKAAERIRVLEDGQVTKP